MALEHDKLLNLSAEMGYQLMISGAEIYRTEDSVSRLLRAYGLDSGEVFAIPNCLNVSVLDADGAPMTRIRRIPPHGTNIDMLERYNALCRELCRETPDYEEAMERLRAVPRDRWVYPFWMVLMGYYVGAFGFCLFFRGGLLDALVSGLCGVAVGLCLTWMSRVGSNVFFKTLAASVLSALLALTAEILLPALNSDLIIIGAYMALVPGVAFTTALRDIMAGDMVSGIAKLAEGVFIAVAIALGTGFAMGLARFFGGG